MLYSTEWKKAGWWWDSLHPSQSNLHSHFFNEENSCSATEVWTGR
jgi:hypothetical protein